MGEIKSNLLAQAIADAKAVRATALSNAKAALEEHFAPKLQSMLSEKLKADVEEEEEAEVLAPDVDHSEKTETPNAEPVDQQSESPAEAPVTEPTVNTDPEIPVGEEVDETDEATLEDMEKEVEESRGTESSGNVDVTQHGVSNIAEVEKAIDNYKTKTTGHKTEDRGQEFVKATSLKTPAEGKTPTEPRVAVEKSAEVRDGLIKDKNNKIPQTDDNGQEVKKAVDLDTPVLSENSEEVDEASLDEILKELENDINDVGTTENLETDESINEDEEEIDIDDLLSDPKDEKTEKEEEKSDDIVKENISLKKELSEYRSAVSYLRDRINEVNLLNAKLLYTNKLFKRTNLNNEQKLRVIESFDLTMSVREAKLVYATLAESLNNGAKKTVETVKRPVSTIFKTVTEGLASKPVASTRPTTVAVLTEGAEMATRFKKLAGINK